MLCSGPIVPRIRRRAASLGVGAFIVMLLVLPGSSAAFPAQDASADVVSEGSVAKLEQLEQAFSGLVDRVSPSVVGIRAQRRVLSRFMFSDDSDSAKPFEQEVIVNGSGVVIDADGLILTNEHVIHGVDSIEIAFFDGDKRSATVVAGDARSDMAVLRVDRDGLSPVRHCEWSDVQRGQWAVAVGNPYGLGADGRLSVSVGVISNLGRRLPGLGEVDDRLYDNMIQTTAEINPGNSGGPLFNLHGELVGIVTAMHTRAGDNDGVGFALPMSPTRWKLVDQLAIGKAIDYGYLGLTVRTLTPEERAADHLPPDAGVIVEQVDEGGPADKAGLVAGDVILRFEDESIVSSSEIVELVGAAPIGRDVSVVVRRRDREMKKSITVQRRDLNRVSWLRGAGVIWRGMRVAELNDASRSRMRIADQAAGVVVLDVIHDSPADQSDVRVGDVIEWAGGTPISNLDTFDRTVRREHGPMKVRVFQRGEITIRP